VKKCENEGQNENQKKAVKLAPKDYVKTLIWFFWWIWGREMLYGNLTYILGAKNRKMSEKMVLMEFFGTPF
jgi:hypothetical protein